MISGTWLGRPIVPLRCGASSEIVGMDPCGGAYYRDCRCGWRCPLQTTSDAAQAAYDSHQAEQENAA